MSPGGIAMQHPRRRFLQLLAGAASLSAVARTARAQSYPERPIRLVVPFPPGGAYDLVGRPWADRMKALLGTIVVENMGGGGSSLGAAAVVRAKPDGYTLLLGGTLPHVNEALIKARPLYDPVNDLAPIAGVAVAVLALAVHPTVPAQTLQEFVAHARTNPGRLSYGHVGTGSVNQLTGELFKQLAGLPELVQVPYRGAGLAMADLISGQLAMAVVGLTGQSLEFHRTGKVRILAVTSPTRLTAGPELSTVAEAGFPGLTNQATIGLAAPAGTATPILEQIAQATRTALADDAYRQKLIESCFEESPDTTPEKFRRRLDSDVAFWTPLVRSLGVKVD
jgi:tripartite-type tricarboxylate transporter receptor subunit TctC